MPFHLGIDQQSRIWVTNGAGDEVIRFPASEPTKIKKFKSGYSGSGLGIDSQGNVWVTNRFGNGLKGLERMAKVGVVLMMGGNVDRTLAYFVGGGLQMQTDLAISPTGDVWVMDNWQTIASCYGEPVEALSTNCGGQGITIFHGMAKPVRAPQIGPARAY